MSLSSDTSNYWKSVDLESIRSARLAELFPSLSHLPGSGPTLESLPSIVRWRVKENVELSWEALASLTVGEILAWKGTGEGKVRALLSFIDEAVERIPTESSQDVDLVESSIVEALTDIAAWGHHNGAESLLDAIERASVSCAPDVPLRALEVLRRVEPCEFGRSRVSLYDPEVSSEWLLDQFDDREKVVLDERTLAMDRRPTLEDLGHRFGVTRERIRQLESRACERLMSLLSRAEALPLVRVAEEFASRLGTVARHTDLGAVNPLDLRSRLLLWIAGPYHVDADWLVKEPWKTVRGLVDHCFAAVTDEDTAEFDEVAETLDANGVRSDLIEDLIVSAGGYRRFESKLVRWDRTYAGRAAVVLEVSNQPMTSSEILDHLGSGSLQSLRNVLNGDPTFIRLGKDRFGLREWGGREYQGVVPAMIERLSDRGALPVNDLAIELAEAFGVSPNSISMNATIHPAFVTEHGIVRLRRDDERYEPDRDLRSARECWLVDGAWALAVDVDEDVLRGSGKGIPEAFAVYIGLMPGGTKVLGSDFGDVRFAWGQTPSVGSLRVVAEELEATFGDRLFVRRSNPYWIDFRLAERGEFEEGPVHRLAFLIGADVSASLRGALSLALGFSDDEVEPEELLELLRRKRADDVVAIFEKAAAPVGSPTLDDI